MSSLVYSPIDLSVALKSVANIKFSVETSKSDLESGTL